LHHFLHELAVPFVWTYAQILHWLVEWAAGEAGGYPDIFH